MEPSGFDTWLNDLRTWFGELSHTQVGIIGGILGYGVGLITGPILRLSLALIVLVLFGLISRSISSKFESRLGMTGVIVAILAASSLGGIQSILGKAIGDVVLMLSPFALALLGAHFAFYIHSAAVSNDSDE